MHLIKLVRHKNMLHFRVQIYTFFLEQPKSLPGIPLQIDSVGRKLLAAVVVRRIAVAGRQTIEFFLKRYSVSARRRFGK
jgi:hypothetical protein